ncbi:MAG: NADPH-dependent glutamate synthase [Planctomycetota bacterium]|nr:NADPH-dependent glutamate synthase [Planctomycetota bacterium]MDI6788348.1 NADPH-dependent glutamate synthase [Planctomycetota bacterium]
MPKEKIQRQKMPEQKPQERIKNFNEVPFGYSAEIAMKEANRCLQCKKPLCVKGCPVEVAIPEFVKLVSEGKFVEASRKIKETNALPAICGRVCPQEDQCEKVCIVGKKDKPVAVGALERFVSDLERNNNAIKIPDIPEKKNRKVAVVGSGPAGLTCAGDLALKGYDVTVFEALHKSGGVLVYGIPEFRLPKVIVQSEVDYLSMLGVKVETNMLIGRIATISDLFNEGFSSVFVGTGAGLPLFLHIPGENLIGVFSANEYLTRVNLMKAYLFPEYDTPIIRSRRVAVVGAGNVAMDSARTALRLGAEKVYLVYRRSRDEMPARIDEIHHAEEEGIDFQLLTNPIEILGKDGYVRAMKCLRMQLGEPDDSGRRRPIPIKGSEFEMEVDIVVVAIGNGPNPLLLRATPEIELNQWGNIKADTETLATTKKGVYAGGDIVTGAATVIAAMGQGKIAARSIDRFITT